MTDTNTLSASPGISPAATASPTPPPVGGEASSQAQAPLVVGEKQKKMRRSTGLWLVDTLIYPVITNFGVFAISVWATYMTTHGDKVDIEKYPVYGRITHGLQRRGKLLTDFLETKWNWGHETADMAKMVAFSFIDGSFVAPFTKLLEDRREIMAKKIDHALGTEPSDEAVYDAEPKQTWKSVILGRFAVASIIVPIAATLSKFGLEDSKKLSSITSSAAAEKAGKSFTSFNDWAFTKGGKKLADGLSKRSWPQKLFGKGVELPYLSKTAVFESFYTMVCSIGLYFSSRIFARMSGKTIGDTHPRPQTAETASTAPTGIEAIALDNRPVVAQQAEAVDALTDKLHQPKPGYARVPAAEEKAVAILADKLRAKEQTGHAWQQRVQEPVDPTLAGFAKA